MLTPHKMRLISAGIFLKAGLDFLEGIGLAHGEDLGGVADHRADCLVPPVGELEYIRHFTWVKVGLTLMNVLVLLYLIWIQQFVAGASPTCSLNRFFFLGCA